MSKLPPFKYALEKIGDYYAPMIGEYVEAMMPFYDWKYLRYEKKPIPVISETPDFHTSKESAISICMLHKNKPDSEVIELEEWEIS